MLAAPFLARGASVPALSAKQGWLNSTVDSPSLSPTFVAPSLLLVPSFSLSLLAGRRRRRARRRVGAPRAPLLAPPSHLDVGGGRRTHGVRSRRAGGGSRCAHGVPVDEVVQMRAASVHTITHGDPPRGEIDVRTRRAMLTNRRCGVFENSGHAHTLDVKEADNNKIRY